ncbi:MAG TPA: hypothetical protein VJ881_04550 [Halanaerobiales bacterium]|nr:hypothetical protein [Halanaerobiales bacterium]
MNKNMGIYIFLLIFIGTLGLLVNEFILKWGTTATMFFSIANIIGLILLTYKSFKKRK